MLEQLKREVCEANLELVKKKVVLYTWGNVSGIDREKQLIVIKPSGVSYDDMKPDDMVVVDFSGNTVEGRYKPSSDTPTHIELYRAFSAVSGVVHTHSTYAVAFAQAGMPIPALGTTHADYFYGDIPCTRALREDEVRNGYEKATGSVIVESVDGGDPLKVPGIIVKNHGPFAWGRSPAEAVHNSVVLERVAQMAHLTLALNGSASMDGYLLDKHYNRKHGKTAYYGQ